MPNAKELLPLLRQMQCDSQMREFYPVIKELIAGIEIPTYDNTELVLELFLQNALAFHCRDIAERLYHFNAMCPPPRKKWYELGD